MNTRAGAIIFRDDVEKVLDKACAFFNISRETLSARDRHEEIAVMRFFIYKYLNNTFAYTYKKISELFNRTHGSVAYGVKKLNELIIYNKNYNKKWSDFMTYMGNHAQSSNMKLLKIIECNYMVGGKIDLNLSVIKTCGEFQVNIELQSESTSRKISIRAPNVNDAINDVAVQNFVKSFNGTSEYIKIIVNDISKNLEIWQKMIEQ